LTKPLLIVYHTL